LIEAGNLTRFKCDLRLFEYVSEWLDYRGQFDVSLV